MTQDEIIEMAKQAGWKDMKDYDSEMNESFFIGKFTDLKAFANLVAQHERKRIESRPWGACKECMALAVEGEREACAKVAEWEPCMTDTPHRIASAIRARGQA